MSLILFVVFMLLTCLGLVTPTRTPQLPACCRRDGLHHCEMLAQHTAPSDGASLTDASCPYHAGDKIAVTGSLSFANAPRISTTLLAIATVSAPREYAIIQLRDRTTSLRGPPSLLS